MGLLLAILLIILSHDLSVCNLSSAFKDFSDECQDGKTIFVYLTTGMGLTDTVVALLATHKVLNCSLKFYVKNGKSVMVVVEFPDLKPNETICSFENNTVNMVSENYNKTLCGSVKKNKMKSRAMDINLVSLQVSGNLSTVLVTATSMRKPDNNVCGKNEATCLYNKRIMCMHSIVNCDGNYNCGVYNKFDEDLGFCQRTTLTPKIIIWSVIIFSVLFWLSVSITFSIMTKRKETFVYKFDDTMFLFGTEKSYSNIDIQIQTILPVKKKVLENKGRVKKKVFKAKRKGKTS